MSASSYNGGGTRRPIIQPHSATPGPGAVPHAVKTFIVEDNPIILERLVTTLQELTPVQVVGSAADGRTVRASGEGTPGEREALGSTVAARLLELGAGAFLPG